jgi:hypothetical protein
MEYVKNCIASDDFLEQVLTYSAIDSNYVVLFLQE